MSYTELFVVDSFATDSEAEIAKGAVESAGIECIVEADSGSGTLPHVAWSSGGYKLLVHEDDLPEARDVLAPHTPTV